ncbi:hypothetical protein SDC9_164385 [bioreactor metagenome]|uniref:Uncharacterized protein n=1 Tax=bioreactor metagenome TaxID=1076179 RepID=A0A645FTG8_9ZZZZ
MLESDANSFRVALHPHPGVFRQVIVVKIPVTQKERGGGLAAFAGVQVNHCKTAVPGMKFHLQAFVAQREKIAHIMPPKDNRR